jgi:hypothetical protein
MLYAGKCPDCLTLCNAVVLLADSEQQQPKSSRGRRKRRATPNTDHGNDTAVDVDATELARPETAASSTRDAAVSGRSGSSLHDHVTTATASEDYIDHFESEAEPAATGSVAGATVSEDYADHFEPEQAVSVAAAAVAGAEPSVVTTATAGTAGYAADEFEVSDD